MIVHARPGRQVAAEIVLLPPRRHREFRRVSANRISLENVVRTRPRNVSFTFLLVVLSERSAETSLRHHGVAKNCRRVIGARTRIVVVENTTLSELALHSEGFSILHGVATDIIFTRSRSFRPNGICSPSRCRSEAVGGLIHILEPLELVSRVVAWTGPLLGQWQTVSPEALPGWESVGGLHLVLAVARSIKRWICPWRRICVFDYHRRRELLSKGDNGLRGVAREGLQEDILFHSEGIEVACTGCSDSSLPRCIQRPDLRRALLRARCLRLLSFGPWLSFALLAFSLCHGSLFLHWRLFLHW
mmetsp:Transcript_1180/g.2392  ORF Transcript_1180/g.2392 Transcript_1180/m.2392 type:complete len:303 (+) Transcript_1180:114-1022(+)